MRWIGTKNLGLLMLAIWLIATGLQAFIHISALNPAPILAVLALAAGILLLLGR